MANGLRLEVTSELDDADVQAVAMLVERVGETDGTRPLSEHVMLHLLHSNGDGQLHFCAWKSGALAGYGHLDTSDGLGGPSAEIAVDAGARKSGIGGAILDAILAESSGDVHLWAHGGHSASGPLARSRGLTLARELLRMRRPLGGRLPAPALPDGVAIRAFDMRFGRYRDSVAWLGLNARAFKDLPDQGNWTEADLDLRIAEPWFDPAGLLLAHELDDDGSEGRLVGFHWAKVHGDQTHGHQPVGEVYVLAVDPDVEARGLGRALTILGLEHLRARGLNEVMLYVDARNEAAVHTYERLGFRKFDKDLLYVSRVGARLGN